MNNTFWTSNGVKISLKLFWVIFLSLLMLLPAFFLQGIICIRATITTKKRYSIDNLPLNVYCTSTL